MASVLLDVAMADKISKNKVLLTGRIPDVVLQDLQTFWDLEAYIEDRPMERAALLGLIADKEGLIPMITETVDAELLDRAPRLKMVASMAVGYNNIDVAAATARGVLVSNTPDVLTDATADLTFALILALLRRIVDLDRRMRRGEFRFFAPMQFLSTEVTGKTLGIVGFGRIGKAVAKRARGFDMRVLYHDVQKVGRSAEHGPDPEYADLERLLRESDVVSLHVPLTPETRHLIGRRELSMMKPTAYLVNVARGPVVDEQALLDALKGWRLAGAGLDVYEHEPAVTPGFTELENVVLLPHVGSATIETRIKMASLAAENLRLDLTGGTPPNLLNPEAIFNRRK